MGFLDKLRRKKEPPPAPTIPQGPDMIQLFHESGAVIYVTKESYRTGTLPGMLTAARSDPDQLATIIVGSIKDGFFSDILEPAEHLYRIDPQHARGTCVYGIALMKNNRFDEAERVFLEYLEKHGDDGAVLTNLAKVYAERKDSSRVEATLLRAVEVDPNTDNGLGWYAALAYERGGEKARIEAWRRIASKPGSWRPQLWLARTALQANDPKKALAYYRESLDRVGDKIPVDLLVQTSGDMGQHGLLEELLDICEPLFVPETHGLPVGNNLLRANVTLGRLDNARRIVNRLRMMKRLDWAQQLDFWTAEIDKRSQ